jgi:hypothetical protein
MRIADVLPLTPLQQGLLFHASTEPDSCHQVPNVCTATDSAVSAHFPAGTPPPPCRWLSGVISSHRWFARIAVQRGAS